MPLPRELRPEELSVATDPETFPFETTSELTEPAEIVGQERAVESIRFAMRMRQDGYNLFALGPPGTGKRFIVQHFLERQSTDRPAPPDICYVNNFDDPTHPKAIFLAAGTAIHLRRGVEALLDDLGATLPALYESDDYHSRLQAAEKQVKEPHEQKLAALQKNAESRGYAMSQTQAGIMFTPIFNGEPMTGEIFQNLPEDQQAKIKSDIESLQAELQSILRAVPRLERELRNKVREINRELAARTLGAAIDDLVEKHTGNAALVEHLRSLEADLVSHARDLVGHADSEGEAPRPGPIRARSWNSNALRRRYGVNVIVDNSGLETAPVVYEDNPTLDNLTGRIEHTSEMGTLTTDFTLIRPGSLHRANGGYLFLDAQRLLMQPYSWEGLKRALKSRQIRVESPGRAMGLAQTVTLEPEPVTLEVKVVLIGDPALYYVLAARDPDFSGLFKVAADFEGIVERTSDNVRLYARLVAELVRKKGLRHLDRAAVARVVDHSARLAGDGAKLSGHIGHLSDLLTECDYWENQNGNAVVTADGVERAIRAHRYRMDRARERTLERIMRRRVAIDTAGSRVGQINGLAVLGLGDLRFGTPVRITARVRLGKGEVVDIEREVEMSGPIHSKGVLILAGFLGARYAPEHPLSLSASLVFEQSYSGVDGDSASSTELYALLSAIADLPIRQSLAVTGSVNQHGEVQSIGGANEKVEGFFDLCRTRGLTGDQGVLIPETNVQDLMLSSEVADAVGQGLFHVYAVRTIDEGIQILTGVDAGARGTDGVFPAESVNGRVEARLKDLAMKSLRFRSDRDS